VRCSFVFFIIPHPPRCTLFPYTTLFRSLYLFLKKMNLLRKQNIFPLQFVILMFAYHYSEKTRLTSMNSETLLAILNRMLFIPMRSEEHTSELQSRENLVCRLLLEKKKKS